MNLNASFFKYQYRRLASGFCWSVFGIGSLILTAIYFPLLNLLMTNRETRTARARRTISESFRLFVRCLKSLGVADVDTQNLQALKEAKGCIIVANHPTLLDYVFIASELPEIDCLVKAQLSHNFFLKGVVKAADYLLNNNSEIILEHCRERLSKGHCILIFPEGTRTVPGKEIKLKRGVAHIALRCRSPIKLIGIHCSEKWLDKSSEWYQIPLRKPSVRLENIGELHPEDFSSVKEESYAIPSRRLTRRMKELLLPYSSSPL